jgi:hypothetical protein
VATPRELGNPSGAAIYYLRGEFCLAGNVRRKDVDVSGKLPPACLTLPAAESKPLKTKADGPAMAGLVAADDLETPDLAKIQMLV